VFDHFYFSLQAAVAGLGVAIGPWHLVRDDLESGVLVAPMASSKTARTIAC
jgi:DNA-binding transcriptional LysR family regulator